MTLSPQPKPSSSAGDGGATEIAAIHPDVLRTHILTRLDGPSLASAACVSSLLRALSSEDGLWRDLCHSAWPSTRHPRLLRLISAFPYGHRSFFSDAFPLPGPGRLSSQSRGRHHPGPPPSELISAVDVSYKNKPVFSTAMDTDTSSSLFGWAPFLVDIEPCVLIPADFATEVRPEDLTVSWIVLDPEGKRAANLASPRPVSVERRRTASWGELLQLRYATVVAGGECAVVVTAVVTCGGKRGGKAQVRDVSMEVEDMEGRKLSGDESLVILREAVGGGRRGGGSWETTSYEEFEARRAERRAGKERRERRQEMVCTAVGIFVYVALCWVLLSR